MNLSRGYTKWFLKVVRTEGCWSYKGAHIDGRPYRRDSNRKKVYIAHLLWINKNGPIPQEMILHHICRNKACINPDHLELKTRSEHTKEHKHDLIAGRLHDAKIKKVVAR